MSNSLRLLSFREIYRVDSFRKTIPFKLIMENILEAFMLLEHHPVEFQKLGSDGYRNKISNLK